MACPMRKYIAAVSVFAALIAALASFFSSSSNVVNAKQTRENNSGHGFFVGFKTRVRALMEAFKWYVGAKTSALFGRLVGVGVKKVS